MQFYIKYTETSVLKCNLKTDPCNQARQASTPYNFPRNCTLSSSVRDDSCQSNLYLDLSIAFHDYKTFVILF